MRRYFALFLLLLLSFSLIGCAEQESTEMVLENVSEAEYIQLMAAAAVINDPNAEQYFLTSGTSVPEVLKKEPGKEDPSSTVYSLKTDLKYRFGFTYITFSEEEFQQLLAWQEETGIQMLYPIVANNPYSWNYNAETGRKYSDDANIWYRASADKIPLDAQGNPQTDLDNLTLLPNYLYDKNNELCYYRQMPGCYMCRVSASALYQWQFGKELTFPFDQEDKIFLSRFGYRFR